MRLPLYLVFIAGVILSIVYWQKHPKVSLWALIGFGIMILLNIISPFIENLIIRLPETHGYAHDQIGKFFAVYGIIYSIIETTALVLVLFAVFGDRQKKQLS